MADKEKNDNKVSKSTEDQDKSFTKKLDTIGWALFFLLTGGVLLVPENIIPQGTWLIGIGVIMLGLNLFAFSKGKPVNKFTIFLGIIALMAGISTYYNIDLPIFPIVLILIGLYIIFTVIKDNIKK